LKRERGRRERIFLHLSWLFRCFVQCVLLLIELQGFYCSLIKPISLKLFFLFFRVLVAVSCLANFGIWVLGFELLTFSLLGFLSVCYYCLSPFFWEIWYWNLFWVLDKKKRVYLCLCWFSREMVSWVICFSHTKISCFTN